MRTILEQRIQNETQPTNQHSGSNVVQRRNLFVDYSQRVTPFDNDPPPKYDPKLMDELPPPSYDEILAQTSFNNFSESINDIKN